MPPFYGETLLLHVRADESPGLELATELTAGTKPAKLTHPVVLSNAGRQRDLRHQWRDPELRKAMPRYFHIFVKRADQALSHTPRYPLLAHPGDSTCAADETKLTKIEVPNLPFNRYQCSKCGRCYSGILYDAWAENWRGEHLKNSSAARFLGMAYGITGEKHYAVKAAEIIRGYIDTYLELPIAAPSAGSAAYSATSGAVRIGASYMSERHWLTGLAIGLDFIREADVLTELELQQIRDRVFAPSANVMMDHKVGVMNLQWMIASAALYAGLATDDPQLVARAMYDPHGILNLVEWGYLPDGNWWENPSYQNVANGIAFPVLTTCLHAGLIPFDERLVNVFKAAYKLCGPDGRSPTLGTGGPGSCRYSDNVIHSLASILDDPQLAWVAYNRPIWQAWSGGKQPYTSFLWAAFFKSKPRMPQSKAVSIFTDKTVLFPDYGGLAMRVPKTDLYCYLEFGRHKVHGHYNKLSINAYGKGGWFVRNVMGGYGDAFKDYLEPVSGSSTIMVDGQNQDSDTGELLFHKSTPLGELASAREVGAWKDVEHERSCILTPSVLVVIDRCRSDKEHTYDWLWHGSLTKLKYKGSFDKIGPVSSLGEAKCYAFFLPATERAVPPPYSRPSKFILHQRPKAGTGAGITFCRPADNSGRYFHTENQGKHDGLILRKRGKTVSFACLMEPLAKDEDPVALIDRVELFDAQTGRPAGLDRAQGHRIQTRERTLIAVVNYSGMAIRTKGGPRVPATERVWITEIK